MTDDELVLERERLIEMFEERSQNYKIRINPAKSDRKYILLTSVFYSEEDNRNFQVTFRQWDKKKIEGFSKQIGLNFETSLLSLLTNSIDRDIDLLWTAYTKWIHERCDVDSIFKLLDIE